MYATHYRSYVPVDREAVGDNEEVVLRCALRTAYRTPSLLPPRMNILTVISVLTCPAIRKLLPQVHTYRVLATHLIMLDV